MAPPRTQRRVQGAEDRWSRLTLVSCPAPCSPLTHTHSPSRMGGRQRHRGLSVCEGRAGSCEESMWWARRGACGRCPPHRSGIQARQRGDREARSGWATAPAGNRSFSEIRRRQSGSQGGLHEPPVSPPEPSRKGQGDACLRAGLEEFSGWPRSVTLSHIPRQCTLQILTLGGRITRRPLAS